MTHEQLEAFVKTEMQIRMDGMGKLQREQVRLYKNVRLWLIVLTLVVVWFVIPK